MFLSLVRLVPVRFWDALEAEGTVQGTQSTLVTCCGPRAGLAIEAPREYT
jgi:hypothetical protein